MNRLFSTYENLVKSFHFFNVKAKSSAANQIEVVDLESFLRKYERRLFHFQNIVFWESPLLSSGITLALSLIFYFLSYCTWKFFASLFSLLLILCIGEVWVHQIWPEIAVETPSDDWLPVNERSFSAAEISQKMSLVKENLDRYWKWLINLRREKPSIFCLSTSGILFILMVTTWYISGLTLVYLSLLGVLCGPALVKRAARSPAVQEYVNSLLSLLGTYLAECDEEEEKILPHITEETKKYLDLDCESPASLDSIDPTQNLSELGVSTMPSHEDVCMDGTAGDEFALPHREPAELPAVDLYTPPLSSVSNTSSSASLVSDVLDNEDMEYSCTPTSSSHMNMGMASRGVRQRRHVSSADEDSEFEMIEHDDVNPAKS